MGLAHCHAHGVVVCDVKPNNVILVHDGSRYVGKLADFGLACGKYSDKRVYKIGSILMPCACVAVEVTRTTRRAANTGGGGEGKVVICVEFDPVGRPESSEL